MSDVDCWVKGIFLCAVVFIIIIRISVVATGLSVPEESGKLPGNGDLQHGMQCDQY